MKSEKLYAEANMLHVAEPATEEKIEQLEKVVRSQTFQGSENLIALLNYLVQDALASPELHLKEYTIATEVFGRGSDFDPRTDSVVRVQAKRLRTKLQEYYDTEGKLDRVLIDLPKGHYKVVFSYIQQSDTSVFAQDSASEVSDSFTPPATKTEIPAVRAETDWWKRALIPATILLAVAVIVLLIYSNINLRRQVQATASEEDYPGVVWEPFLRGKAPTLAVLSNPSVYRFTNNADPAIISKDSIEIGQEQINKLSDVLRNRLVMKQGRAPRLVLSTDNYTGIGEAIGLYHLTNLFRAAGKPVALKQSRTVSAEDMKNNNVIVLGSAWVNEWVEKLPVKEDFIYSVNATIENLNPMPGEEPEYKPKFNDITGEVEEDYALITVKPGVTDEHRLMILAGVLSEGTQAAAEYVTRKEYLNVINQRLQELSENEEPPKYYQVLLKVNVDDGIPTTVSILAIHELKVTRN